MTTNLQVHMRKTTNLEVRGVHWELRERTTLDRVLGRRGKVVTTGFATTPEAAIVRAEAAYTSAKVQAWGQALLLNR